MPVPNYVDENVSTKVVKIIQSYTGIVNKMGGRKEDRVSAYLVNHRCYCEKELKSA